MGNSRNKEFLGFKLHAVPSSVRSSLPPPVPPGVSPMLMFGVPMVYALLPIRPLAALWVIRSTVAVSVP